MAVIGQDRISKYRSSLAGVRGWLWLLCVTFVVLNPMQTLNYYFHYSDIRWDLAGFPVVTRLFHVDLIVHVPLTLFSVYAGIELWKVRPHALRLARSYLYAHLSYSALLASHLFVGAAKDGSFGDAIFIALLGNTLLLTPGSDHYLAGGLASYFGGVLVWVAIVLSYLKHSRRVKATYGAH